MSCAASWSGASSTSGFLSVSGFTTQAPKLATDLPAGTFREPVTVPWWTWSLERVSMKVTLSAARSCGDGGEVQFLQRCAFAHDGRALTVFPLHPAEVGVRVGLAVEEFIDEALLVVGRQVRAPPGVEPLVADRGGRDRAQGLAAGAAGTVGRVDLDVVRQGQELVPQAGEELLGPHEAGVDAAGGLIQQVRAAQVAGEHKVTGEQVAGLVAERAVGHQEGQVLRGVARGVQGLDA